MTWPQLMAWLDQMNAAKRSKVDTWEGSEGDEFWQAAAQRRRERMGR